MPGSCGLGCCFGRQRQSARTGLSVPRMPPWLPMERVPWLDAQSAVRTPSKMSAVAGADTYSLRQTDG
eukprot:2485416-Alexandrium_andersonii.AAC.1